MISPVSLSCLMDDLSSSFHFHGDSSVCGLRRNSVIKCMSERMDIWKAKAFCRKVC